MLGRVMVSQRKPSEASGIRSSMRRGSIRTSPTDMLLSLHNAFVHFFFCLASDKTEGATLGLEQLTPNKEGGKLSAFQWTAPR